MRDFNGTLSSRANSPRPAAIAERQKAVSSRESILAANVYQSDELRGVKSGHQELSRVNKARGICFFLLLGLLLAAKGFSADKNKTAAWKPITQALLRVDDQPIKNWNVYEENKKGDPLLLQMGNRYLLIQVHERKVFELAPAKIEHKGTELLWDTASLPSEPLATADWLIKDVGFAYRIGMRLLAENRVLDLQLPHPMDLRYL